MSFGANEIYKKEIEVDEDQEPLSPNHVEPAIFHKDDEADRDEIDDEELKRKNKFVNIQTLKKKNTYTMYDLIDRYHYRRW
jgi:hypothetical protein